MFVSVIGGSNCSGKDEELAEAVGIELGRRSITVICGGLTGVMTGVCRGARSAGGTTVGILPGGKREDANPYVDIPIVTTIGEARNIIVVSSGQAVIAIGGEYGTLSEIAYALRNKIPVVGLNTWSMSRLGNKDSSIVLAETPAEAVEKAVAAIRAKEEERKAGR
ncbi:MAG: TIGR00725 family protein [Dehalococcoidia bacterium]|nr:TIGR00725 family protein [Dehalococcoidia bacterium]